MAGTPLDEARLELATKAVRKRRFERTGAIKSFDPSVPPTDNDRDDARAAITAYLNSGPERDAGEMREAAVELAQYASYAEIVGWISGNRSEIRKWCDKVFALNRQVKQMEDAAEDAAYAKAESQP